MINVLIGVLVGVSLGTWLYTKFMRRTGGNTQTALIVSVILGLIAFFITWSVAVMIDGMLQ